jgi:hypothetical protein
MKKNTLNTAVLASLAGVAGIANISNAVYVNADGTGQVLLYPYYTAQRDNQTLLSIVNTTTQGKAVKIRFLEGRNSREVLDFNLFLSPEDVWTAAVLSASALSPTGSNAEVPAALGTFDQSCVVPGFIRSARGGNLSLTSFVNYAYSGTFDDTGPTSLDRTREGHIEIIEMATVVPGAVLSAITHANTTGLPTCANLPDATGAFAGPPTGGLFGGAAILDISQGSYINYNAIALEDFASTANFTSSGSVQPDLTTSNARSDYFVNGQLVRSTWGTAGVGTPTTIGQRIDAVSSLFMSETLIGEWNTERFTDASSEWVITFPTKRFYVDTGTTAAIPPFTNGFTNGQSCDTLAFRILDREEFTSVAGQTISPPAPQQGNALCYETNILTFNQALTNVGAGASSPTRTLRSALARNLNTPNQSYTGATQAGWMKIGLTNNPLQASVQRLQRASVEGHINAGLPAQGFWALQILNTNVAAGQAPRNYGGAYDLKRSRVCGRVAAVGGVFTPGGCAL